MANQHEKPKRPVMIPHEGTHIEPQTVEVSVSEFHLLAQRLGCSIHDAVAMGEDLLRKWMHQQEKEGRLTLNPPRYSYLNPPPKGTFHWGFASERGRKKKS